MLGVAEVIVDVSVVARAAAADNIAVFSSCVVVFLLPLVLTAHDQQRRCNQGQPRDGGQPHKVGQDDHLVRSLLLMLLLLL